MAFVLDKTLPVDGKAIFSPVFLLLPPSIGDSHGHPVACSR
jgi:hypothetical protein